PEGAGSGARGRDRIAELTGRYGGAAPGMRRIVDEVWGAVSDETARTSAPAGG
ncbi:GPP34 family phosphoprotein, partial [Streptomyces coelicoflavus]|nr:GPP34 family phosphoprotein [Streptomyces coelicoflavus]